MAEQSGISWTDSTFNPWMGCTKVSPACTNCYAERDMDHRYGKVRWGPNGTRVITSETYWNQPYRWEKQAVEAGKRRRVFCASLADIFEDWQGPMLDAKGTVQSMSMSQYRNILFKMIEDTPGLDWMLLTKRPENISRLVPNHWLQEWPSWTWIGCSVENQKYADERIPILLDISAKIRFLSCEPLVGSIDLTKIQCRYDPANTFNCLVDEVSGGNEISWIITGGESGPHARNANQNWYRSLRDQAILHGVPFHFKQWGEWLPFTNGPVVMDGDNLLRVNVDGKWYSDIQFIESMTYVKVGKKAAGRLLDGRTWDEFPNQELCHGK